MSAKDVLQTVWPTISSHFDQDRAACREWIANDPGGQAQGLYLALLDPAKVRDLDDDSLTVVARMALAGMGAAIESVVTIDE